MAIVEIFQKAFFMKTFEKILMKRKPLQKMINSNKQINERRKQTF